MSDHVEEQRENNGEKLLGGVTGKGFLPGQSGNPGGRPKGGTLTPILRAKLGQEHPAFPGKTWAEVIVEQAMERAALGEFRQFKEILDRVDGPVRDEPDDDGEHDETPKAEGGQEVDA